MRDEAVNFAESARVHQQVQAFPGGELAARVLLVNAALPAAQPGLRLQPPQIGQVGVIGRHRYRPPPGRPPRSLRWLR